MSSNNSALFGLLGGKGKSKSLGLGALGSTFGGGGTDVKPNEFGGGGKPTPPRAPTGRSRTLAAFKNVPNASSMMRGQVQ